MILIKLNFINGNEGTFVIDEPGGFDDFSFKIETEKGRYGRDVSFSENNFSFFKNRNHEFDLLLFYFRTYGWESRVEFIIDFDGVEEVMGLLDFSRAVTDQIEIFECSIIDDNTKSLIKKRDDIETDLFSSLSIDDNVIIPVVTNKILFKTQPVVNNSLWTSGSVTNGSTSVSELGGDTETRYFNPIMQLEVSDIDDSFIPFSIKSKSASNFELIKAVDNIKNIKINFIDTFFDITSDFNGGANGNIVYKLVVATALVIDGKIKDDEFGNSTLNENVLYTGKFTNNKNKIEQGDFEFDIPFLERGLSILIYWSIRTKKTSLFGTVKTKLVFGSGMKLEISGTTIPFNTVIESVRLVDAIKYNVESISEGTVSFPMGEIGGEYFNHFISTGKLLRSIKDTFAYKFKDTEEFITEFNGDFQINSGNVFIGTYADFYSDNEIATYDDVQFDSYEVKPNESYTLNKFTFEYDRFFSQREERTKNTAETIHGKSSYVILNKQVEDKKEVKVSFTRDPIFIQEQIKIAITESDETTSNADQDIFIIHGIVNDNDVFFTENAELRHSFNPDESKLSIINSGNFDFILLGIDKESIFEILPPNKNAGKYTVFDVLSRTLILIPVSASPSESTDGVRRTLFKYLVSKNVVPFVSASGENIQAIENKLSGSDFANLEYTVGRNITRFWGSYLATANLYTGKDIKNTEYLHGKDIVTTINGLRVHEGGDLNAKNNILNPFIHKITVIKTFEEFVQLKNSIKNSPGYIRFFDNIGSPVRVYPRKIGYNVLEQELVIEGEEKADNLYLNINNANNGFIIINGIYITRKLSYKIQQKNVLLFDDIGMLLLKPIFWNLVSLNGKLAQNIEELELWLKLLS